MQIYMVFSRAMAALTANAMGDVGISILGIGLMLGIAVVTGHAFRDNGSGKAQVLGVVAGAQVPDALFAIPGEWHFKQEPIFFRNIAPIVIPRTNDIFDLADEVVGESIICICSEFSLVKAIVFPKGLIDNSPVI